MKYLLYILIQIGSVSLSFGQWESMNGPYGGFINDLDQNKHFQFAATTNGLYRSANEGQSWNLLQLENGKSFACLQIGIYGDTIMTDAINYEGEKVSRYLFRSEDSGETWKQINRPEVDDYFAIATNGSHIYLSDTYDLWVSVDEGKTWNQSKINTALDRITSLERFDDRIYVNEGYHLFLSNGMPDSFDIVDLDTIGYAYTLFASDSLFLVEGNSGKLFRSIDGGKTWDNPFTGLIGWISFFKQNNTLFFNSDYTIYKSTDNGFTWKDQRTKYLSSLTHQVIATDSAFIGGSMYTGIQSSRNEGKTFEDASYGLSACYAVSLALHNGRLFASTVYKGISSFNTEQAAWDINYSLTISSESISDIAVVGENILAATGREIYKSIDNGMNWSNISPDGIYSNPYQFYPYNELILAGGSTLSYLIISDADGSSWDRYNIMIDGKPFYSYLFAQAENALFVSQKKVLLRSLDQGITWDTSMQGFSFEDPYSFIDKLYAFHDTIIALEFNESSYVFTMHMSIDNGTNWQEYHQGIPYHEHFGGIKSITKYKDILIGCMYNDIEGIYVSYDHGVSWQPFNEGLDSGGANEAIFDDEYLYLATSGQGVWRRKISDLYTVSTITPPTSSQLLIYPNPSGGNISITIDPEISGQARMLITDLQGTTLLTEDFMLEDQNSFGTSHLPSGMYILSIETANKVYSGKFIIAK